MPDLVCFSRNRHTAVEPIDQQTLRVVCRLQDTLTDARVEIRVKLPDLEIVDGGGRFHRSGRIDCREIDEAMKKVRGVRIGSGLHKILTGLITEAAECPELLTMVEECCQAVILSFTKDPLALCPGDPEKRLEFFRNMVRDNTRLVNRCAAFGPGSSILEGLETPERE